MSIQNQASSHGNASGQNSLAARAHRTVGTLVIIKYGSGTQLALCTHTTRAGMRVRRYSATARRWSRYQTVPVSDFVRAVTPGDLQGSLVRTALSVVPS